MTLSIRTENVLLPDSRRLIAASEEALRALFPPEECFSFSAEELATPNTQFLVARVDSMALGCVALVDQLSYGEIKRLYVAPEARGLGIARALMAALENAARDIGLKVLRLESGPALTAAMQLYASIGYHECAPFGGYPDIASNIFLEKRICRLVTPGWNRPAGPA